MSDLLVNLYHMQHENKEAALAGRGILIKRAVPPDKEKIVRFVRECYGDGWVGECEAALFHAPVSCFVAVKNKEVVGFSCYDATAKGYFGPIGIAPEQKGTGIGQALMYRTLDAMKEDGYGYAVIGWAAEDAMNFYKKSLPLFVIPDSGADKSLYQRMVSVEPSK